MPRKAGPIEFVVNALLGRNDLAMGHGPLKRADNDVMGALKTQA